MLETLQTWWSLHSGVEKFYWVIAIPFTLLFLIQLVMTFLGGDADSLELGDNASDLGADITDHGGFHFFTVKNLIGFFTIFAWSGLACLYNGLSSIYSIVISSASGIAMMLVMASIFYLMSRLAYSGNFHIKNCIGVLGEVYLTIPANREGLGKVHIKVQGALREIEAMTDESNDLKQGSLVKVIQVINEQALLVSKYK